MSLCYLNSSIIRRFLSRFYLISIINLSISRRYSNYPVVNRIVNFILNRRIFPIYTIFERFTSKRLILLEFSLPRNILERNSFIVSKAQIKKYNTFDKEINSSLVLFAVLLRSENQNEKKKKKDAFSNHSKYSLVQGCIYKFLETTKDHLIILGAVGLGLSVLELFGIVLGSCLYIKLRHDFDDWELLQARESNNNGRSWCRYMQNGAGAVWSLCRKGVKRGEGEGGGGGRGKEEIRLPKRSLFRISSVSAAEISLGPSNRENPWNFCRRFLSALSRGQDHPSQRGCKGKETEEKWRKRRVERSRVTAVAVPSSPPQRSSKSRQLAAVSPSFASGVQRGIQRRKNGTGIKREREMRRLSVTDIR